VVVTARVSLRFKPGRLPPGLSFWHPIALFCTWFGSGLLPKVPGTWGSAAALPFAAAIQWAWGGGALAFAAVVIFVAGSFCAGPFARMAGVKDPGAIVVDEVAAQWATLSTVPLDPVLYFLGFVLFRIADIAKPWPASWCDRRLSGGFGVMADDMVAGLYASAVMFLVRYALRSW
jgi:phosphatidylglycerophosphatase A